jgi:hypothetical protein
MAKPKLRTQIFSRKVPLTNIKVSTLEGEETFLQEKLVDAFEIDKDYSSRVVKKILPICQIYVKKGCQDIADYKLRPEHVRNCSCDVWNARSTNLKKYGTFKTDWEISEEIRIESETISLENFLIY